MPCWSTRLVHSELLGQQSNNPADGSTIIDDHGELEVYGQAVGSEGLPGQSLTALLNSFQL
jgi:hypothetical protein